VPVRALEQEIEVDPEEAARMLGWRAAIGLEEGLRSTVEWFRSRAEGAAIPARL
jgi:nucleoside-diphosphate-sugar epimerase